MKRILFLLLLIPSLAWGQVSTSGVSLSGCSSGGASAAAGPTCNTKGDLVYDSGSPDDDASSMTTGNGVSGSFFNPTSGGNLYSVEVKFNNLNDNPHPITFRYGTGTDLTTPIKSVTVDLEMSAVAAWREILVKDTASTISNGTTYYIGLRNESPDESAALRRDNGGTHQNGYDAAATGWTLGSARTDFDYTFKIYKCAD